MGVAMALVILLYLSLLMYGIITMRSVLEEKTTRTMEVLISAVHPFELLAGKILGVAGVAFTQFFVGRCRSPCLLPMAPRLPRWRVRARLLPVFMCQPPYWHRPVSIFGRVLSVFRDVCRSRCGMLERARTLRSCNGLPWRRWSSRC